jgi:hypothetical protein
MRVTEDKNGEPFGFCENGCAQQLRIGGNASRVAKFRARYAWAQPGQAVAPAAAPAAAPTPAPKRAADPKPAATPAPAPKRAPTFADALMSFGVKP